MVGEERAELKRHHLLSLEIHIVSPVASQAIKPSFQVFERLLFRILITLHESNDMWYDNFLFFKQYYVIS